MEHATIFGGFGGQGLLFAGHVLAQAAVIEGRMVSWMPSYGPEMRGGTASCTVIIADHPIGSPIVDSADSVVALNPPSLAKFEPLLVPGGLLILNDIAHRGRAASERTSRSLAIPCSALARAAGDERSSAWSLSARPGPWPMVAQVDPPGADGAVGATTRELLDADLAAFIAAYEAAAPAPAR